MISPRLLGQTVGKLAKIAFAKQAGPLSYLGRGLEHLIGAGAKGLRAGFYGTAPLNKAIGAGARTVAGLGAVGLAGTAGNEGLAQMGLPHFGPEDLYNPAETYYGANFQQSGAQAPGYWFARPRQSLHALFGGQQAPSQEELIRPMMQHANIEKPRYDPVTRTMKYQATQTTPPAIQRLISQGDKVQSEYDRLGINPKKPGSPGNTTVINYNPYPNHQPDLKSLF